MKKLRSHLLGIDQGDVALFADFENGGAMWTGTGPRERRKSVTFSDRFRHPPSVQAHISLWDADTSAAIRAEITVEHVTEEGCDLVFRTWGDTRFARIRVAWVAMGELHDPEEWELY